MAIRLTIDEMMDLINACPDARRWAKRFGKRAFKKTWLSCERADWLYYAVSNLQHQIFGYGLRPSVHDRNTHLISRLIHLRRRRNRYKRLVPANIVREIVSWEYFRDLLGQVDDMFRRQL